MGIPKGRGGEYKMNEVYRFACKSLLLGSKYLEGVMNEYVDKLNDNAIKAFDRGNTKRFFDLCHRTEYREGPIRDFFKDSSKVLESILKGGVSKV